MTVSPIEIRVAVLEAQQEAIIADVHDVKSDMKDIRDDVRAGNRLTITNLVVVLVALLGIIGILFGRH